MDVGSGITSPFEREPPTSEEPRKKQNGKTGQKPVSKSKMEKALDTSLEAPKQGFSPGKKRRYEPSVGRGESVEKRVRPSAPEGLPAESPSLVIDEQLTRERHIRETSKRIIDFYQQFKENLNYILDIGGQLWIPDSQYAAALKEADELVKAALTKLQTLPNHELASTEKTIALQFKDLFVKKLLPVVLEAQKRNLMELLEQEEDELPDDAMERFEQVFGMIQKQRIDAIGQRIDAASSLNETARLEMEKMLHERQVLKKFISKELKGYDELEHLYMGEGVCFGACVTHTANQIHGKAPVGGQMFPFPLDGLTRYYQAAHDMTKQDGLHIGTADKRTQARWEEWLEQYQRLFTAWESHHEYNIEAIREYFSRISDWNTHQWDALVEQCKQFITTAEKSFLAALDMQEACLLKAKFIIWAAETLGDYKLRSEMMSRSREMLHDMKYFVSDGNAQHAWLPICRL